MKKSLVALAALAVAGVASAQSSVTLYGTLDAGLEKIEGQRAQLQNSRNGTTQLSVSGVEDLGGGLKARFQIATSFDATYENGAAGAAGTAGFQQGNGGGGARAGVAQGIGSVPVPGTTLGNNGMFLALDSGIGSLVLGRPTNTLFAHQYTANSTKGVTGFAAAGATLTTQGVYTSNAIQYVTPNFGGFTVQAEYAPSEGGQTYSSTKSLGLRYAAGPIGASLVYDRPESNAATKPRIIQLAGSYDFGVLKLFGTYQDTNAASNADQAYVFGVTVPVGPGTFWAQYGVTELAATDGRIFTAGYKYSLSKRTTAYVNFGNRNSASAVANGYLATSKTGYGVGLQHNF